MAERTVTLPESEAEFQELANDILSSYEAYYFEEEHSDCQRFSDADHDSRGIQTSAQGVLSFLLLSASFNIKLNKRCSVMIQDELEFIIQSVSKAGYNLTPKFNTKKAKEFRNEPGKLYSIDTSSLVLSALILAKWTHANELVELSSEVISKLKVTGIESLALLCDGQHASGGWSFAGMHGTDSRQKPIGEADLYHTYAASETLADLGDYVLGETKGVDADPDMADWFGPELLNNASSVREEAANWLTQLYVVTPEAKTPLGICPIQPPSIDRDDLCPNGELTIPPFESKGRHNFDALYWTLYVIDSLIVNGADDSTNERFQENAHAVRSAIAHGIYLSRIQLDHAFANEDYWTDAEKSRLVVRLDGGAITKENNLSLEDQNLLPLALRCNALYCYYVSRGPDSFMDIWMRRLLNSRDKETGLWDNIGVSVAITEKSIEALVDYYDYFKEHNAYSSVSAPANPSAQQPIEDSEITRAIRNIVKSELANSKQIDAPHELQPPVSPHANEIALSEVTDMFVELAKQMDGNEGKYREEEILSFCTSSRSLLLSLIGTSFEDGDDTFDWPKTRTELVHQIPLAKQIFRSFQDQDYTITQLADFLLQGVKASQSKHKKGPGQ